MADISTDPPLCEEGVHPILLEVIIESAIDAIIALDVQQQIVLFNPAAELMFKCPANVALGQPLDRFLPARFRASHRHLVTGFAKTENMNWRAGNLNHVVALRANGEEFPIETSIAQVAVDGKTYVAITVRDMTGRAQVEASSRRHADLLDLTHDAILTWEWRGKITFWNRGAEQLYGYTRVEAVGKDSHELLHPYHPNGLDMVLSTLEQSKFWEGELTHIRRDGSEVLVESRLVLIDEGESRYVLEANQDITERSSAEAEGARSREREAESRAETGAAIAARDALQEILDDLPGGVLLMTGFR